MANNDGKMIVSITTGELPVKALKRLSYVLEFINAHPFTPDNFKFQLNNPLADKQVDYRKKRKTNICIYREDLFFTKNDVNTSDLVLNPYHFEDLSVLVIENRRQEQRTISPLMIPFDVFENIFFHISRYEEVVAGQSLKDEYGRIESKGQLLVRENKEKIPVADLLVKMLLKWCRVTPNQPTLQYSVTHDIDVIRKFSNKGSLFKSLGGSFLRTKSLRQWSTLIESFQSPKDPYDVYDWMLLPTTGIDKCIYLLVGGTHKFDTWYNLDQPILYDIKNLAKERGYDIGLHPSMSSWKDARMFESEKIKLENWLGQKVFRSRQHFLRFDWSYTPDIIESMHIKEDTSLGYSDRTGFRCGTGVPYQLYNFSEERNFHFTERPLICMDISLIREADGDDQMMRKNLQTLKSSGTPYLSFNFHNNRFFDSSLKDIQLKQIYLELFSA